MIPQIREVNFGPNTANDYATLHQATVSLQEMGERGISTQVRIDGDVVPDFSGWELEFNGERFVLPTAVPQAAKDNTTRNALVDLNFTSWIISELKRYYFVSLTQIDANTAIADQYKASVILPLRQFVELFNRVLKYYFGDTVRMDLFQPEIYSTTPVSIEINYSHIWDVLTKFYELFKVRWNIAVENGVYVIKVGYAADSIEDHDFKYGYEGGLLRFERQVQDENITNILLGRGGEKNLPYRYFKLQDPDNPEWTPDPDAIPELANVYFDRLRDAAFRWYVRGWMRNPKRDKSWDGTHTFPTYSDIPDEYKYAYNRGRTDEKFNPVEFVKDDDSIAKYGEHWGALDDNDEIYPTIQGVTRDGVGRVDAIVDVSEITTDDIQAAASEAATVRSVGGTIKITNSFDRSQERTDELRSERFTIPEGSTGNLYYEWLNPIAQDGSGVAPVTVNTTLSSIKVVNTETGTEYDPAAIGGIPDGTYYAKITVVAKNNNTSSSYANVTYGLKSLSLTITTPNLDAWKPTFDVWVKNIWGTAKTASETDEQYASRVWEKILGDRVGNEAKIVFSDGFMSISEDYEFQIAEYPTFDQSKTITVLEEDGQYHTYQSEWKITLRKSDAEFDATGKFVPSADGGKPQANDHFFFIGIDMPFSYVEWAEETLHASKRDSLDGTADINPTWVINLDKVRVHTVEQADYGTSLAERLAAGATVWIKDKRFTSNQRLKLYVQSITYTWNEPSDGSPYLVPDIEVVLSDKVVDTVGPVAKLQDSVEVIRSNYAKMSDIEQVVRRVAEPLFLKKTGEADSSVSPTQFASKVSSVSFRQGDIGGEGWGFYTDTVQKALQAQAQTRSTKSNKNLLGASEPEITEESSSVLELDKLVIRKELRVNSLVANQIAYVGGRQINSAASIECTQVVDSDEGYYCYFNQKRGSVANLFVVGDFAMGQMFDPVNVEVRYYKARVDEVGQNYILLSKTVKDGAGAPEVGDVMVQHGHESNTARQFVIVRDVIGGGYERMLSGLNSVSAAGNEYYFAGRLAGQNPRWFVGDNAGEYAEWVNGRLNIKGTLIVRNSDGTYQAMTDYMSSVASAMDVLQAQIDGQIQSWSSGEAPSEQTEPFPQVVDDVVDPSTANFPASSWGLDTDRERHFGDIYVDDSTGQGYRYTKRLKNGATEYYWTRITDEEVAEAMRLAQLANQGVAGLQYLKQATNGGTLISGGLVLTSMIQLGQAATGGAYNVWAGINGTIDDQLSNPMKSIAAWYGGPMVDHEADPTAASYAKSLFRMDGSGYLASGNIHWDQSGYGGIPGITWNGNDIVIGGNVKLASLTGDSVTDLVTAVRKILGWFGEDQNGDIFVQMKDSTTARNFYSYGAVTAGGVGSGGGGGGGDVDLPRVWESLTNNTDFPNVTINPAHIPDMATIYGYLKGNQKITLTGVVTGSGTTSIVTSIADGALSIAKTNGLQAALNAKQDTISDLSTIRTRSNEGHTIYGYFTNGVLGLAHIPLDDRLSYVDPEAGEEITIEDPGTTGMVLWGAESANNVALDVNGVSKILVKQTALDGINSSIASLSSRIATKQDIISDLSTIRSNASQGATAHGWGDHRQAGYLTSVPTASADTLGLIKVGSGLAINNGVLSVTGQTHGTVTRVDVGSVHYGPDANGVVSLPAYPVVPTAVSAFTNDAGYLTGITSQMVTSALGFTPFNAAYFNRTNIKSTLGISDWALEGNKPGYNFSEINGTAAESQIPSLPYTKITGLGDVVTYNVGSVVSGNGGLVTGGAVYSAINSAISSAIKFQGITTTALTDGSTTRTITIDGKQYTANKGDEVIYGGKEYLWTGSKWQQLGDEESWALKTVTITGTGYLTGGGTLEQNRTIDISASVKSLIDNAVPNTRKVNGHALSSNVTVTKADVGLGSVDDLAASAYFTLLENSGNQVSITIGGTNKKLTVDYASAAGNASTLENHAASYFATAAGLTTLAGRVSTLEDRTNWDDYFGVDANGDVYVKKNGENARDFYSYGAVTAGGVGTGGGGGGGVDIDRVWESLTNNTDKPNVKINIAHIPNITTAKVTDIETWIAGKGYVTSSGITSVSKGTAVSGGAVSTSGGAVTIQFPTIPTTLPASDVYAWAKNKTLQASDVPSLTVSKISDIETWISGKNYLTGNQSITLSGDVSGSGATSIAVTIGDGKVTNAKLANSSITIAGTSVSLGGAITAANLRSLLSINNVENTALSTWAGTDKITTLGTITTGVWNGSKIMQDYLDDIGWDFVRNAATYDTEDYIHVNS